MIRSALNSNIAQPLDQHITDRFNQQDARLNSLETRLVNLANTSNDQIIERVTSWRTVASHTLRHTSTGSFNLPNNTPQPLITINPVLPGNLRISMTLTRSHLTNDITIFAMYPPLTGDIPGSMMIGRGGVVTTTHTVDIPSTLSPIMIRASMNSSFGHVHSFTCTISYDFAEDMPRRLPGIIHGHLW